MNEKQKNNEFIKIGEQEYNNLLKKAKLAEDLETSLCNVGMYFIYMHTCPNGKHYIGITSIKVKIRLPNLLQIRIPNL